jgi:hypothetical protein
MHRVAQTVFHPDIARSDWADYFLMSEREDRTEARAAPQRGWGATLQKKVFLLS